MLCFGVGKISGRVVSRYKKLVYRAKQVLLNFLTDITDRHKGGKQVSPTPYAECASPSTIDYF